VIVLTRGELSQLDAKTQTKLRDLGKPMFGAPFVSMPPKAASSNAKSLAAHQRPGLVTGIARPQRVIDDLHSIGISPHATRLFRDHQHVVLDSSLIASCDALITTAKDWHRDRPVFEACKLPIYVINVRPDLSAAQLSNILGSVL
jgi:tetraacyldisaccharide-1-P 4'-kinase